MEETGHYYTVYFTSLAVGFDKFIAHRQALLAQMPDEVGWLDAANMHISQCINSAGNETFGREYDLNTNLTRVPADWRYRIEFALHSLKDKRSGIVTSKGQREITRNLLLKNAPDSLAFGLLLHRLGDTYAHSVMHNEEIMYTTTSSDSLRECITLESLGHARHQHAPDYPYLRPTLFYDYVKDLYGILKKKYDEGVVFIIKMGNPKTLKSDEVLQAFKEIIDNLKTTEMHPGIERANGLQGRPRKVAIDADIVIRNFIAEIRKKSREVLNVEMDEYAPEKIEKQTLNGFLKDHPELKFIVNANKLESGLKILQDQLEK